LTHPVYLIILNLTTLAKEEEAIGTQFERLYICAQSYRICVELIEQNWRKISTASKLYLARDVNRKFI
jgi:hypothetical protein